MKTHIQKAERIGVNEGYLEEKPTGRRMINKESQLIARKHKTKSLCRWNLSSDHADNARRRTMWTVQRKR
jgi:hypothetical protein